jgi:hypothetical protein
MKPLIFDYFLANVLSGFNPWRWVDRYEASGERVLLRSWLWLYANRLRSFKLEYHVCLTCSHPNRENNTSHLLYLLIQEPAIIQHRCGRPAGSMAGSTNRISQHSSEILATLSAGAGAGVAIYRRQIEAAASNLVLTAPRRALYTSQLKTILIVVLNHIFIFWFSRFRCKQVKHMWYSNLKWKDVRVSFRGCIRRSVTQPIAPSQLGS